MAWRMGRHGLLPRSDDGADGIVTRLCGVQAQVMSAAALAAMGRAGGTT